jgi:hypothetical protein
MDPELQQKIDRIAELTDSELTELETALVEEFDRVDGEPKTPAIVQVMQDIATAHDQIVAEQTTRADTAAAAEATANDLRSRMHVVDEGGDGEEGEDEGEGEEGDGAPALAASTAKPPARPSAASFNSQPQGRPRASTGPRASSQIFAQMHGKNGRQAGEAIKDRDELAQLMTQRIDSLGRGSGERMLVASVQVEYPEERRLTGDPVRDAAKISAVVDHQALVASGGVCNPVAVDYSLFIASADDEPIAAALPNFQANRGGVRFMSPPTFAGVGSSGTAVWTEATDANPGTATKPVQTISCGNEVEVFVDAIPTRIKFGNMMARFFPEMVDANTQLAEANAARIRELYRLSKISASSTVVSSGQLLGAARDILATLDQAAAAYCYRSRINRATSNLRALLPDWAKDMFRADLARTYSADPDNILAVSDADIEGYFTARGVNITWFLDGQAAVTGAGVNSAFQGFGAQGNNATLLDWPHNLVWWLFAEGSFQRLDGGRMDIGVVRDSTLDSTNDYETFIETFEGVAFRGFEALQVVSAVRPNGAYAGSVTTATSPNVY